MKSLQIWFIISNMLDIYTDNIYAIQQIFI
jgi:hypothetical protein